MAQQDITINNHFCDWNEIMDACEAHGLKPTIDSTGKHRTWVSFKHGNTEIYWFIKWSLDEDWHSYWTERDELSQQSGGFTALNAGQSNSSVVEVATPRKHSDTMRGIVI